MNGKKFKSLEDLIEFLKSLGVSSLAEALRDQQAKQEWQNKPKCLYKAHNVKSGSYQEFILQVLPTDFPKLKEGFMCIKIEDYYAN